MQLKLALRSCGTQRGLFTKNLIAWGFVLAAQLNGVVSYEK
jgi:hypothetical protein